LSNSGGITRQSSLVNPRPSAGRVLRRSKGKRPEQDGVCNGKDGDVRAETEGQNTGRGNRNRRIAAEKPQAVQDAVAEK
jgi:hypothetical protein